MFYSYSKLIYEHGFIHTFLVQEYILLDEVYGYIEMLIIFKIVVA